VGSCASGITTNDVWNHYADPYRYYGVLINLFWSSGTNNLSGVQMVVTNMPGQWNNNTGDIMYDSYICSYGSVGKIRLTGLPASAYDVYLYGHGGADNQYSSYSLYVGTNQFSTNKSTASGPWWNTNIPPWRLNTNYVVYTGVVVSAGQVLEVRANATPSYGVINGLQVLCQGTNAAPQANAGTNRTVSVSTNLVLYGTASDDGLPLGSTLALTWNKVSGPSAVQFSPQMGTGTNLNTTVRFDRAGTNVLSLTASDSALSNTSQVTVTVTEAAVVDSDNDGLPDAWEIFYFGDLSQAAYGDYNGDGRSNLEEYQQGTDPTGGLGLQVYTPLR
jgi:hypothetical protein